MSARGPAYELEDFIKACLEGLTVTVLGSAMATAPSDFGLMTVRDVIAWIGSGGLERPRHANTAPWLNNPNPEQEILVDSYDFYSGPDFGYLAFMFRPKTSRWLIKSFKKNDAPDPRPLLLADRLRKAGIVK